MKHRLKMLLAVGALAGASQIFAATGDVGSIPSDYDGLTWSPGWNWWSSDDPGFGNYLPESDPNVAYTQDPENSINFGQEVTVDSVYVTGYFTNEVLEGFDQWGNPIDSTSLAPGYTPDDYWAPFSGTLTLDWTGVQYLSFGADEGVDGLDFWVMDDLSYSTGFLQNDPVITFDDLPLGGNAVPDSTNTLFMVVAGLGALFLVRFQPKNFTIRRSEAIRGSISSSVL